MKKIALLAAAILSISLSAQTDKPVELNCYNKWSIKFEERGADPVADGVYDDVIITNRQGAAAKCFNGRAEVKMGQVVKIFVLLDNGSYEELKRNWKNNSNSNVAIINGISTTMQTMQGELINVLWPKKIKSKKAKPTEAPEPTDD